LAAVNWSLRLYHHYISRVAAQSLDVQALPASLYLLRDQTTGYTTKLVKKEDKPTCGA
jgi:hypothetical protein